MPIIRTKRGEIHYKDYRKEKNESPLLLIHGAGGIYLDWPIQLRRDAEAIAFDLAGHGKSSAPSHRSIEEYAADTAAFIESIQLEKVIVAGHSMGGAIAQILALDYPHLLKGLILVGTAPFFQVNPAIITGLVEKTEETAKLIVKWQWAKHVPESIKEQSLKRLLETPAAVIQGDYLACNVFDVRERLGEIKLPTLVLVADSDKMIPPTESKLLTEKIPNADLVLISDAGHMFHLEQVELVTKTIQSWITNLP